MSESRKGVILKIEETQEFQSGFKKRTFVLKTDEKYPQELKMELHKDDVDHLDKFTEGSPVEVFFNIRGNEYNGRHFVDLVAWKMREADHTAAPRESEIDDLDNDDDIY